MLPTDQPPTEGQEGNAEEKQCAFYEKFKRKLCKPRFAIEVVALVAVVLYTIFAGYQSCKLRETTEATKESADAVVASVRAWIVLSKYDPPTVRALKIFNGNMPFVVEFQNAGKTPATDITSGIEFVYVAKGEKPPKFSSCPKDDGTSSMLINAGQPFSINPEIKPHLSAQQIDTLANGSNLGGSLYIHGCVHYHDVLTRQARKTEFCGYDYAEIMFSCPTNNQLK